MRTVIHRFDTAAEAAAFVEGVDWVNDSAIEFTGYAEEGVVAVFNDEDHGNEPLTVDHRETVPLLWEDTDRIDDALQVAAEAFYGVIALRFPEVKTGDVEPLSAMGWEEATRSHVRNWIRNNIEET